MDTIINNIIIIYHSLMTNYINNKMIGAIISLWSRMHLTARLMILGCQTDHITILPIVFTSIVGIILHKHLIHELHIQ